jgi:hypothetical protein
MTIKEEYSHEIGEQFDFDEQLRTVCDMKTSVTIQETAALIDDGLIHVFRGLRRDPIRFYVEETGAYCFINPEVCLMACRGLIWITHEMNLDDYEPTPAEARAMKAAAAKLGFSNIDEIAFHSAEISFAPTDSISVKETNSPILLH